MDHLFPVSYDIGEVDGMGTTLSFDFAHQGIAISQDNGEGGVDHIVLSPSKLAELLSITQKHIGHNGQITENAHKGHKLYGIN